jgi:hypothetical protein
VSDEYEILANLDLTPTSQALSGRTDIISVKGKRDVAQTPIEGKGKKYKKMKAINESIYFDVSKPFESMRNKHE